MMFNPLCSLLSRLISYDVVIVMMMMDDSTSGNRRFDDDDDFENVYLICFQIDDVSLEMDHGKEPHTFLMTG